MDTLTKICVVVLLVLILLACPVFITKATVDPNYRQKWQGEADNNRGLTHKLSQKDKQIRALTEDRDAQTQKAGQAEQARRLEVGKLKDQLALEHGRNTTLQGEIKRINSKLSTLKDLSELNAKRTEQLSASLAKARKTIDKVTEENRRIDEMLEQAQAEGQRLEKVVRVLHEQISDRQQRIKDLEGRLAAGGVGPAGEADGEVVVATGEKITGTITAIRGDLASINIGSAKGIKPRMKLIIYRGAEFVGHLRVEEVDVGESAGIIVDKRLDPMQGDKVTTSLN